MSRLMLCGMMLFAIIGLSVADDVDVKPIGFVIETPTETGIDVDASQQSMTIVRDGVEVKAVQGDEVYAGDVLVTNKLNGMTVAFVDQSAVRLETESELRVSTSAKAEGLSDATLVTGRASVSFPHEDKTPRSIFSGVGNRAAAVTTASPAKLDIFIVKDASGGTYTTTVGVIKGIATVTPKGASKFDLSAGGSAIMTINTQNVLDKAGKPITGTAPVNIEQVSLTKDQITALQASAVTETLVSASKGKVTIKSTQKNSDGSVTVVSASTVNGVTSKSSSKTTGKSVESYTESSSKISFSSVYEGYTIKSSNSKPSGDGKATIKSSDKSTFSGTTHIDLTTGILTFTTTKPAKNGDTVIYTYNPKGATGIEQSIVLIKAGVATMTQVSLNKSTGTETKTVQTGTIVNGKFTPSSTPPVVTSTTSGPNPTSSTLPDGHAVDQGNPPKTTSGS